MKSVTKQFGASIAVGALLGFAFYLASIWGCAPKPVVKGVSPERQKTIEDSLRREREYELAKTWSTGYEYYKNKMYKDALPHLWRVTELDTAMEYAARYGYDDIFVKIADCYIKLNVADSAQYAYELGIEKFPDNAYQHKSLGYILMSKGEVVKAIGEYERVVELKAAEKDDYKILADLYIKNNRLADAIATYEKVVELDPEDKKAQDTLATLYKATGQEDEAIARKEKILERFPNDTVTMMDLGRTYYDRGENEKVINILTRLTQLEPKNIRALEYLGGAYQNLEKYPEAIGVYQRIVKLNPKDKKIYLGIATCYKFLKQFSTARRYVNKALTIDRNYGLAYITMGEIYEASAEDCISSKGGKISFDDKLVYEKAYKQYQKAKTDPEWIETAKKRMEIIKLWLPTTEDRFFYKGKTEPTSPCYNWIKR